MGHLLNYHHYLFPYRIEEYSCKKHLLVEIKKKKIETLYWKKKKIPNQYWRYKKHNGNNFTQTAVSYTVYLCIVLFNFFLTSFYFIVRKKKIPPIKRQKYDCNLMLKNITSLCIRMLIILTCYHFLYTFTYSKLIH